MITMTIREAIFDERSISPGYVYVVRDKDVVFYVGMSQDPTFRLCQHLGIAASHYYVYPRRQFIEEMEEKSPSLQEKAFLSSSVGTCIRDNAPGSLEWAFDIYEKQDAIDIINRTELPQAFPRIIELMEMDWFDQRSLVETALIKELKPFLNSNQNAYARNLPERYRSNAQAIANEAIDALSFLMGQENP